MTTNVESSQIRLRKFRSQLRKVDPPSIMRNRFESSRTVWSPTRVIRKLESIEVWVVLRCARIWWVQYVCGQAFLLQLRLLNGKVERMVCLRSARAKPLRKANNQESNVTGQQLTPDDSGQLRTTQDDSGRLRTTQDNSGRLCLWEELMIPTLLQPKSH